MSMIQHKYGANLIDIVQGSKEKELIITKDPKPNSKNLIQLIRQYSVVGPNNNLRDNGKDGQRVLLTRQPQVDMDKVLVHKMTCQTGGALTYERRITSVLHMKEFPEEYFSSRYAFVRSLGEGSSGQVKLATHLRTGEKVAVKVVNRQCMLGKRSVIRCIEREIAALARLSHPNIANIFEVILTKEHIYIITEYAPGGELFDYIIEHGKVNEKEARRLFRDIVKAIAYVHRKSFVHRDLKPENILLDCNSRVKLIDFGFSNRYFQKEGRLLNTHCGSPAYSAPELLQNKPYYGPEVDVWSTGVILYTLLCGKLPFDGKNYAAICKKILSGQFALPVFLSEEVKSLLCDMLKIDPLERITVLDIRYHAWFDAEGEEFPLELTDADDSNMIDFEIIGEMEKGGFNRATAVSAILNGCQNEMTTTYRLLVDRKRRSPETVLGIRYSSNFRVPEIKEIDSCQSTYGESIWNEIDVNYKENNNCELEALANSKKGHRTSLLSRRASLDDNNSDHSHSDTSQQNIPPAVNTEKEIRGYIEHRILFKVQRTSKLHPGDIIKEIRRILRRNGIAFSEAGYILTCFKFKEQASPEYSNRMPRNSLNEDRQQNHQQDLTLKKIATQADFIVELQFKLEVCKISLSNRHGVHCKKIIGNNDAFKKIKKLIFPQLCL